MHTPALKSTGMFTVVMHWVAPVPGFVWALDFQKSREMLQVFHHKLLPTSLESVRSLINKCNQTSVTIKENGHPDFCFN